MLSTEYISVPSGVNWVQLDTTNEVCDIQNISTAVIEYAFNVLDTNGSRLLTNQWIEGLSGQDLYVRCLNKRKTGSISIVRNTI